MPISEHDDKVVSVTRLRSDDKPEDFLSSFAKFLRDNVNKIAALQAVVQRPRELTRADLKALRTELDQQGFSEAALRHAWKQAKNEDIAASIVGFIRQAALGDPLCRGQIVSRRRWIASPNAGLGASHNANGLSVSARPWRRSGLPTAPCWMKDNSAKKWVASPD